MMTMAPRHPSPMKYKSALKQSISAVKFQVVFVIIMAGVAAKWTNGYTLFMLGLGVFYLLMEAFDVFHIKRKSSQDPTFLDRKIL